MKFTVKFSVLILMYIFFVHSIPLLDYFFKKVSIPYFTSRTYIGAIVLSDQKRALALEALTEFDSYTDKNIVRYYGLRPILIQEGLDGSPNLLGQAEISLTACIITLSPNLTSQQFKQALIHEYIHCHWIMHDHYNPCSLMFPNLSFCAGQSTYEEYARKVGLFYDY